ncbi:hypothetical protein HZA38_03230 [Candidatus Peregrinibacteria bacterium]|nr:hypothetical protein [Candidatus Peregrinibacteria bacterium]
MHLERKIYKKKTSEISRSLVIFHANQRINEPSGMTSFVVDFAEQWYNNFSSRQLY